MTQPRHFDRKHLPASLLALLLAVLLLPALLLATPVLLAQPPGPGGGGQGPGMGPGAHGFAPQGHRGPGARHGLGGPAFLASYLDLTEQQKEQVRALHQERREASRPIRERMRTLRRELHTELQAEAPNTLRVGELSLALHEQRQEMRQLRQGFHEDLKALLTTEQQEALERLVNARKERREARRERRESRPGAR